MIVEKSHFEFHVDYNKQDVYFFHSWG